MKRFTKRWILEIAKQDLLPWQYYLALIYFPFVVLLFLPFLVLVSCLIHPLFPIYSLGFYYYVTMIYLQFFFKRKIIEKPKWKKAKKTMRWMLQMIPVVFCYFFIFLLLAFGAMTSNDFSDNRLVIILFSIAIPYFAYGFTRLWVYTATFPLRSQRRE